MKSFKISDPKGNEIRIYPVDKGKMAIVCSKIGMGMSYMPFDVTESEHKKINDVVDCLLQLLEVNFETNVSVGSEDL